MRRVSEHEVADFVGEVIRLFSPERVILFGSHASGTPTPASDVDLLIVMDFEGRSHQMAFEIRKRIKRSFPLDLVVRRPDDVDRRLTLGDMFLKEIIENGKILYERTSR